MNAFAWSQRSLLRLDGMLKADEALAQTAADKALALAYYAGHCLPIDGVPYLVPVDVPAIVPEDLRGEAGRHRGAAAPPGDFLFASVQATSRNELRGTQPTGLRDAERRRMHSHKDHGNDIERSDHVRTAPCPTRNCRKLSHILENLKTFCYRALV